MEFHECEIMRLKYYCRTPGQCQYCHVSIVTEDLQNPTNPVGRMLDTDPECEVL
jgi:ferredoxin